MKLYQCYMMRNRWYDSGKYFTPSGIVVHSSGANNPQIRRYVNPEKDQTDWMYMLEPELKKMSYYEMLQVLGTNQYNNDWNRPEQPYGMHFFVGKLADDTVGVVQCLRSGSFLWGCGSGRKGSYNSSHLQFEICEDTTDPKYTKEAYWAAVELCAYLCEFFKLPVNKIVSHKEAAELGYASNHGDPDHWFQRYGLSMDGLRRDVQRVLEGETEPEPDYREMTKKRFGFDDRTMNFLDGHPYKNSLYYKLATKD